MSIDVTRLQGVMVCFLSFALASCSALEGPAASVSDDPADWNIVNVYWSDGDSGRLTYIDKAGERTVVRFRLNDVDGPETGGVGAAIGGAKCELEREAGFEAKAFVNGLTRGADVRITATEGYDRMREPRLILNLDADGVDVTVAALEAGHIRPWPHEGPKALSAKPDWCE